MIKNWESVIQAIEEFDQIGREAFLSKYGFSEARSYFLVHNGKSYNSQAIVGAAFGFENPAKGPLVFPFRGKHQLSPVTFCRGIPTVTIGRIGAASRASRNEVPKGKSFLIGGVQATIGAFNPVKEFSCSEWEAIGVLASGLS